MRGSNGKGLQTPFGPFYCIGNSDAGLQTAISVHRRKPERVVVCMVMGPVRKGGESYCLAQKRAGARLRSRSSSGQADKIAVVFMLENSCDVPTTRSHWVALTAFRKKMQPARPCSLHFRLLLY